MSVFFPSSSTRSNATLHTVVYTGGNTTVEVNQREQPADLFDLQLGRFLFSGAGTGTAAGEGVRIDTRSNGKHIIDAITFTCAGPPP